MGRARNKPAGAVCVVVAVGLAVGAVGCDLGTYAKRAEVASAGYVPTAKPVEASAGETDAPASPAVGKWSVDGQRSADASRGGINPVMVGGAAKVQELLDMIRDMELEFDVKADGTFTAKEVMDSRAANYKGKWTLRGNRIALNQTHENGKPVADKMDGTLNGREMNLTHRQQGLVTKFVFRKVGQ